MAKGAHLGQPVGLGLVDPARAVALGDRGAHVLEILAGIEALGDRADRLAQRLLVAQVGRLAELVDLGAGIVDVVFLGDGIARLGQQVGQRIAHHGAARMRDVQRPGRIGRDVLDIDLRALAHLRIAIGDARLQALAQPLAPEGVGDLEIDEARPRDGAVDHVGIGLEAHQQRLGDVARLLARGLGQHHGGVGRDVAMRRIARRLGGDGGEIERGRQFAGRLHGPERAFDLADEMAVGVHGRGYCLKRAGYASENPSILKKAGSRRGKGGVRRCKSAKQARAWGSACSARSRHGGGRQLGSANSSPNRSITTRRALECERLSCQCSYMRL